MTVNVFWARGSRGSAARLQRDCGEHDAEAEKNSSARMAHHLPVVLSL
jgi:hypothetical protein